MPNIESLQPGQLGSYDPCIQYHYHPSQQSRRKEQTRIRPALSSQCTFFETNSLHFQHEDKDDNDCYLDPVSLQRVSPAHTH